MKSFLFMIVFLSCPISMWSNNPEWDKFIGLLSDSAENGMEIKRFIENHQEWKRRARETVLVEEIYSRTLYEPYVQNLYQIKKCKKNKGCNVYHLQIIEAEDKVIFAELASKEERSQIIYFKTKEYDTLIEYHSNYQGIAPDTSHTYFNPTQLIIVGFACGAGGTAQRQFHQILQYVSDLDKKELMKWCSSLSAEIRCYGAIGLNQIKEEGVQLTAQEIQLLEKISKERTYIYHCSGCTSWGFGGSTVEEMYTFGNLLLDR